MVGAEVEKKLRHPLGPVLGPWMAWIRAGTVGSAVLERVRRQRRFFKTFKGCSWEQERVSRQAVGFWWCQCWCTNFSYAFMSSDEC